MHAVLIADDVSAADPAQVTGVDPAPEAQVEDRGRRPAATRGRLRDDTATKPSTSAGR
jgi:hypothetical protein